MIESLIRGMVLGAAGGMLAILVGGLIIGLWFALNDWLDRAAR